MVHCLQCTLSTVLLLFIDNKMTVRNSISFNRSFTAILVIKKHFFPLQKQMLIPIIPIQGIVIGISCRKAKLKLV